ncbi:MAG: S46 family peptidase [Acidobacteria bacterium]|nr:S46 family peptidase [Acidobacteriota bacterium]
MTSHAGRLLLSLLTVLFASQEVRGDEGMWTFDNLPLGILKTRYNFAPDQAWLDHVRMASVRVPHGSASFVSKDGLLLTNHHVAHGAIQQVSGEKNDYLKNGFVAASRADEIKIPGYTAQYLVSTENITGLVEKAVMAAPSGTRKDLLRAETIARLVAEENKKSGLHCESVALYQGGEEWIYRYKLLNDVRLVMAPEFGVAAFGGDWDNFTYPRHDLDMTLFRVYENGKPFHPPHHLTWAEKGASFGDLIFMVGHPGNTNRLDTLAQMKFALEEVVPFRLRNQGRMKKAYRRHASQGPAQAMEVSQQLMSAENFFKVFEREWAGLKDTEAMGRVAEAEQELRARVAENSELKAYAGDSWNKIEEALQLRRTFIKELFTVNTRGSVLFELALHLVRLPEELAKSPHERLGEYRDEKTLQATRTRLEKEQARRPEEEVREFTIGLEEALEELGAKHPFVEALLEGKSPADAAKDVVARTRMHEASFRKELLEKGTKAIQESKDPFILLARTLDPMNRTLRKAQEGVRAVISEHAARIAKARFAVYGKSKFPDATFTLRLSFGTVSTCRAMGTLLQPFTTFGGLFDRADAWGPEAENKSWALPQRWRERRHRLDPSTPFNFLSTHDSIGGNSGSPIVNRKGELVGLVFDGNIDSIPGRYYYDERVNRSISVDARGILEALEKVYDASHLVTELRRD